MSPRTPKESQRLWDIAHPKATVCTCPLPLPWYVPYLDGPRETNPNCPLHGCTCPSPSYGNEDGWDRDCPEHGAEASGES